MLEGFERYDSNPVLSSNMNIVLKTSFEERKEVAAKKTEKIKKPKPVKQAKQKVIEKKKLIPVTRSEVIAETEPESITEPAVEPASEISDKHIIEAAEISEIATPVQQSYVAPRSDASYLSNPKPFYPRAARRRGMQGMVILEVEVSIEGLPQKIEIEMSSGFTVLDVAALESVRKWRFVPAQRNGIAVVASVDVPVRFVLNEVD